MEYSNVPKRINVINEEITKINYEINQVCPDGCKPRTAITVTLSNYRISMSGKAVFDELINRRQGLNDELAKLESANDVLIKISEGLLK